MRVQGATAIILTACLWSIHAWAQNDPHFQDSAKSWGQSYPDQWALKRINLDPTFQPQNDVVVAIIDTGLDFLHPDITRDRAWVNVNDPLNGRDDDNNGFVDDYFGWDFINEDNMPWDDLGHGTHVAGTIAAITGNELGIAGMNARAKIMVLKAMNFIGHGRTMHLVRAIHYAVDHGAQVINISMGGHHRNKLEDEAIRYAIERGVVVVIAAGNEQQDVAGLSMAGVEGAITVGASNPDDEHAPFSNYGERVDVVAPGIDVLSTRARQTDLSWLTGVIDYEPGSAFVGEQAMFYRATGTSFSAPFVTGVASLLLSANPRLTPAQVKRMIVQNARDIEAPGVDLLTGYGLLDADAALAATPDFFVNAEINRVRVARIKGQASLAVIGVADANQFKSATLSLGEGQAPQDWQSMGKVARNQAGELVKLPATAFEGSPEWTLRLVVEHANGRIREHRYLVRLN